MKKRGNRVLAGLLAVLVVLGAVPVQTMGAQYGIQKNKYLDVKKTPTGKTGQNMTISMIFDNSKGSEDLQGVSVRFDDSAVDSEYDAAEDPDEETRYNGSIFPFEITSSIFDAKVIGSVKAGATKTVSLSARVRRDIAEGYYSVPIIVKANGSDATTDHINVWITKSSGTTESGDDEGSIRFELGENQSTPSGQYPDVMNFTVNLRNASNITAFDVNVRMGLSADSTKFPFNINDGNYVRHFDRVGGGRPRRSPTAWPSARKRTPDTIPLPLQSNTGTVPRATFRKRNPFSTFTSRTRTRKRRRKSSMPMTEREPD